MSFRAHGNWCGPGWSAHQWKDAKDLTEEDKQVEAIDALDQACKEHDIGIAEGDPLANKKFYEKASAAGWYGLTLAQFVKIGGPPLQNYLRGGEEINKKMSRVRHRLDGLLEDDTRQNVKSRPRKSTSVLEHPMYERQKMNRKKQQYDKRREIHDEQEAGMDVDLEEEKEDPALREMMDAVEENEAVINALTTLDGDLVTPTRPTPVMAPNLSRGEGQPLRGPREVGSLTNLLNQSDNNMDPDGDAEMTTMASRSAAGEGAVNRTGNRETLVKYNSRSEMGIFTETRTAYLPLTVYFSINRTDMVTPVPLHFRVDWPFEIFKRNTLTQQELRILYNEGTIRAKGLSNDMAKSGNRNSGVTGITTSAATFNTIGVSGRDPAINQGQLFPFPTTVIGSTAAVQGTAIVQGKSSSGIIADLKARPAYRVWYAKMYQYAHCMETDWRVTYFSGDSNEEFQNIRVYEGLDCQSTGNIDTIPVDCELGTVDHWPYLKKHDLITRHESKPLQQYSISGKWNPNKQHPMKMVANEEDIKTWTKLGTTDFLDRSPAAYREDVTLLHYSHPDSNNIAGYYNVRVDLRYKIQFKDLANNLRWPRNTSTVSLNNLDTLQVPYPTQSIGIDPANPERVFADGVTNPR